MTSPLCGAIHISLVEFGDDMRCDAHFPEIDPARFRLWSASDPRRVEDENEDGGGGACYIGKKGTWGPCTDFIWRHFGARYKDMHEDYTGQGVDQLADVISRIKSNPSDRRLLLTAWNPADLSQMVLPPCHMFCQFFVSYGELSYILYISVRVT